MMGINVFRTECYLAILKKFKQQFPDAHFEVITRTCKSVLSPSKRLLNKAKETKMDFGEYKILFLQEILNDPDSLMRLEELREIAKEKMVFLVCYEKDASKCHRSIVKDVLEHPNKYGDLQIV